MLKHLHGFFVHYPIALLTYGLILRIVAAKRPSVRNFAQITWGVGCLMLIPAIVTGWFALGSRLEKANWVGFLPADIHQGCAYITFLAAWACFGIDIGNRTDKWRLPSYVTYLLLAIFVSGLFVSGFSGSRLKAVLP